MPAQPSKGGRTTLTRSQSYPHTIPLEFICEKHLGNESLVYAMIAPSFLRIGKPSRSRLGDRWLRSIIGAVCKKLVSSLNKLLETGHYHSARESVGHPVEELGGQSFR